MEMAVWQKTENRYADPGAFVSRRPDGEENEKMK